MKEILTLENFKKNVGSSHRELLSQNRCSSNQFWILTINLKKGTENFNELLKRNRIGM